MRYVVREGDTFRKIANRFGIGVNALLASNPALERRNRAVPGEIILVPEAVTSYETKPGDTIYYIAQTFGVSPQELQIANALLGGIALEEKITSGIELAIPSHHTDKIVRTDEEYTSYDVERDVAALQERYPFLRIQTIGHSVTGKPLYAVQLGQGAKEFFYSGAWHANEWITASVLMKFVEDAASAFAKKETLRGYDMEEWWHRFSIWIVPMVNPDGVELSVLGIDGSHPYYPEVITINNGSHNFTGWTANARGVDLNHQWPALWDEEARTSPQHPAPRHYGGPYPLSEPEAQAIYEFTKAHDFLGVLAYHSQGQEIFWGFRHMEPAGSEEIVHRMQIVSTYKPVHTADSFAGYKDWFIQQYRRPGYTIEVGVGVNPVPIAQFDIIYNQNQPILVEAPLLFERYTQA